MTCRQRAGVGAVIATLAGLWSANGLAAVPATPTEGAFDVAGVAVDVSAASGAQAQAQAIVEGQRRAFTRLVARLVPAGRQAQVPVPDAESLAELVQSFQVANEKSSRVRYLAELTVRFKPAPVRDLLRTRGIPFAETQSKPVVILPVYNRNGVLLLWDDPNPWRTAWAAALPRDGLVPMIVPSGALADINDIGPEQAMRGELDRLRAIAARHGAADAMLALVVLGTDPVGNRPSLRLTIARYGSGAGDQKIERQRFVSGDETESALLDAAARDLIEEIEEGWKRDNMRRFGQTGQMTVAVPIDQLDQLVEIERRLAAAAAVEKAELVSLSRRAAQMRLTFSGDSEQLRIALAQRDLVLSPGPVSPELRLGGERARAAGPSVRGE